MPYEVIVVGGGLGGLTTAALLSGRGLNVCLFERASPAGGCVTNFEFQGFKFEPTAGLYSGWEPGGIYDQIFSELTVAPPEVRRASSPYTVRLPDRTDVVVVDNTEQFECSLRQSFPECGEKPVSFYRQLANPTGQERPLQEIAPELFTDRTSRFCLFVEAQLQMFAQASIQECTWSAAAAVLLAPQRGVFEIAGGAESLATSLSRAIRNAGGTIRLDTPVLRLAYGADGSPIGVDLLTGESVVASRAIISNLTIWDTYGKLIGPRRTPSNIASDLKARQSWGAYLLFLALDESVSSRLGGDRFLAAGDLTSSDAGSPPRHFFFAAAPQWDKRAPDGKRAVTVWNWTDVGEWFTFHEDNEKLERMDQDYLEQFWSELHEALPELGDGIEIIETATPQTYYERTRRKLGMVGHPGGGFAATKDDSFKTVYPNVFVIGDTVNDSPGIAAVSSAALGLANYITSNRR
ncbi:MAG TPA: FAD-dependent oxidoreductase [Pyrinomonadaceae bacterium]|nr:FAD-dependent oxidoreductase [Pyrinomonadaceae bacterium]